MPDVAQLIGGAGTGKTTRQLELMAACLERGIDPLDVGFISFTRAARREAAERAAGQIGLKVQDLEQGGWFRTVHSIAYRCLGVTQDQVVSGNKADREWLASALQCEVTPGSDREDIYDAFSGTSDADRALMLWSAARSRLEPLRPTWEAAEYCDDRTPSYELCVQLIERYEEAKRLDGRVDFTDLLGQYAGWRFDVDGPERRQPRGDVPNVEVWFLDEWQDASALLDDVAKRLVENSRWVYCSGDPAQSIYSFGGADARHFMAWGELAGAKRQVMPKSYRCPAVIHGLGEEILRGCSDYWDRGIAPADHDGQAYDEWMSDSLFELVDPRETWLLLARTNVLAAKLGRMLDDLDVPWVPTKGGGKWAAPVKNKAFTGLASLQADWLISAEQFRAVTKNLPQSVGETYLFERGTKKRWLDQKFYGERKGQSLDLSELRQWGATENLLEVIRSGRWVDLMEGAQRWTAAVSRWGEKAVNAGDVRVGTIHSAKGAEASRVMLLTTLSGPIVKGTETTAGRDAELRCWYVGVTRAREELIVVKEHGVSHRKGIPL